MESLFKINYINYITFHKNLYTWECIISNFNEPSHVRSSLSENKASIASVVCSREAFDRVSSALSRSATHFLPTNSDNSSCLSSAVIVATMRHDVVSQSSGEQSHSILCFSSSPAHPTTGEFSSSMVRLIAPPTSIITISFCNLIGTACGRRLKSTTFTACCQALSSRFFLEEKAWDGG